MKIDKKTLMKIIMEELEYSKEEYSLDYTEESNPEVSEIFKILEKQSKSRKIRKQRQKKHNRKMDKDQITKEKKG